MKASHQRPWQTGDRLPPCGNKHATRFFKTIIDLASGKIRQVRCTRCMRTQRQRLHRLREQQPEQVKQPIVTSPEPMPERVVLETWKGCVPFVVEHHGGIRVRVRNGFDERIHECRKPHEHQGKSIYEYPTDSKVSPGRCWCKICHEDNVRLGARRRELTRDTELRTRVMAKALANLRAARAQISELPQRNGMGKATVLILEAISVLQNNHGVEVAARLKDLEQNGPEPLGPGPEPFLGADGS